MTRLLLAEYKKLLGSRILRLGALFLLGANFFFLYISGSRSAIPPPAYRSATAVLQEMPLEEQAAFLEDKIELLSHLGEVELVYREYAQGNAGNWSAETIHIVSQYKDRYLQGGFLEFTDTIEDELLLSKLLLQEVYTVQGYPDFLAEIQQKAQQLGNISIFQQSGWNQLENELTCAAYAGLQDTSIHYAPQKGILQALNFKMSDIFLVFGVLLFAFWVVRSEIESGMMRYIRSFSQGRTQTALAKLAALWITVGGLTLLLYGSNLLWCALSYGLGPLERSIQSLPSFLRCPYPLTIAQYIGVFLLAKWAAACVMGTCILTICTVMRKVWAAGAFSLLFVGVCALLYWQISGAGCWNVLKYATPVSLLQTNELVGGWQCLHWFGTPAPRHFVALCAALAYMGAAATVYFLCFQCRNFLGTEHKGIRLRRKQTEYWKHRSLLRMELFKLHVLQGTGLFLLALLLVQLQSIASQKNYLHPEEMYYKQDMTRLSGRWDADRYAQWQDILKELQPLSHPETLAKAQETALEIRYRVLKERVYPQLLNKIEQQKNGEKTQLVYSTGYEQLFHPDDSSARLQMTLWASVLSALCFAGVFASERSKKLDLLLASMTNGKEVLIYTKLRIAIVTAIFTAVLLYLPNFTQSVRFYGLPALSAPSRSLEIYQESLFASLPLGVLVMLDFLGVTIGCIVMTMVILWLGCRLHNTVLTILLGWLALSIFPLLETAGIQGAGWLSMYPLFHIGKVLQAPTTGIATILLCFVWLATAWLCKEDLLHTFGSSE